MAWGVEGFVVSFIAPHSLTARALVVAPGDLLTVHNRSESAVDVAFDGRPAGEIAARRARSRPASCARRPTSRCCPGRRSTGACARSSGAWRRRRLARLVADLARLARSSDRGRTCVPAPVRRPRHAPTSLRTVAGDRPRSPVARSPLTVPGVRSACRPAARRVRGDGPRHGVHGRPPRRWYPHPVLRELRVENLLLIDRAELRLAPGLNVLTGETGAGKTVLAHALDLLLGGKPRPGIVRPGAAEAYVEGVFDLPDDVRAGLGDRLPADADELVLARRVGADGRTRALVNGRSANVDGPARGGRRRCCRSTASTSIAG